MDIPVSNFALDEFMIHLYIHTKVSAFMWVCSSLLLLPTNSPARMTHLLLFVMSSTLKYGHKN